MLQARSCQRKVNDTPIVLSDSEDDTDEGGNTGFVAAMMTHLGLGNAGAKPGCGPPIQDRWGDGTGGGSQSGAEDGQEGCREEERGGVFLREADGGCGGHGRQGRDRAAKRKPRDLRGASGYGFHCFAVTLMSV